MQYIDVHSAGYTVHCVDFDLKDSKLENINKLKKNISLQKY